MATPADIAAYDAATALLYTGTPAERAAALHAIRYTPAARRPAICHHPARCAPIARGGQCELRSRR